MALRRCDYGLAGKQCFLPVDHEGQHDLTGNPLWPDAFLRTIQERNEARASIRHLLALCDEADQEYSKYNRLLTTDEIRATLAPSVGGDTSREGVES